MSGTGPPVTGWAGGIGSTRRGPWSSTTTERTSTSSHVGHSWRRPAWRETSTQPAPRTLRVESETCGDGRHTTGAAYGSERLGCPAFTRLAFAASRPRTPPYGTTHGRSQLGICSSARSSRSRAAARATTMDPTARVLGSMAWTYSLTVGDGYSRASCTATPASRNSTREAVTELSGLGRQRRTAADPTQIDRQSWPANSRRLDRPRPPAGHLPPRQRWR